MQFFFTENNSMSTSFGKKLVTLQVTTKMSKLVDNAYVQTCWQCMSFTEKNWISFFSFPYFRVLPPDSQIHLRAQPRQPLWRAMGLSFCHVMGLSFCPSSTEETLCPFLLVNHGVFFTRLVPTWLLVLGCFLPFLLVNHGVFFTRLVPTWLLVLGCFLPFLLVNHGVFFTRLVPTRLLVLGCFLPKSKLCVSDFRSDKVAHKHSRKDTMSGYEGG